MSKDKSVVGASEMGTQAGGGLSRYVHRPAMLEDVVGKIKATYPIIKACHVDFALRQLLLCQLLQLNWRKQAGVIVPKGLLVQPVNVEDWEKYVSRQAGINPGQLS